MTTTSDAKPDAAAKAQVDAKPSKPLDEFGVMAKDRLKETIEQYNVVATQVKAASGDPQELLEVLRDSYTEDETANKIRAAIEEIDNKRETLVGKLDEVLKPIVEQQVAAAKEGTEGAEARLKDLQATVNAGRKYLTDLYGEGALEGLPTLVGKRRASSGGGGAGDARRIRGFDVYVDGALATSRNGKGEQVSNMAAAAKQIGVETEQMREAFWAAAGTDDSKKYPPQVEFVIAAGEGDERKQYTILAKRVDDGDKRATEQTPAA